ncbi:MAG TPA: 30S ribosomal protein S16, partial [Spirochaetota bacterium]|nr:30S ribosomal protein S16 [Spirochaetota bacterium]HQI37724.1 30S ribosomal protein S16 [Spirochaetota bacterium]
GTKKKPFYKVVVIDSRKRRDGAVIESLGHYQPIVKGDQFVVDRDKVTEWLKKGAQPTETIAKLLNKAGITG